MGETAVASESTGTMLLTLLWQRSKTCLNKFTVPQMFNNTANPKVELVKLDSLRYISERSAWFIERVKDELTV